MVIPQQEVAKGNQSELARAIPTTSFSFVAKTFQQHLLQPFYA
jgi:hypothetical protein